MLNLAKLKKFRALFLYYGPRDRNYDGAIKRINECRKLAENNEIKKFMDELKIPESIANDFSAEDLKKLILNITASEYSPGWSAEKSLDNSLFKGIDKKDSVNDAKVRTAISRGIEIMKASKDPIHDLAHIARTVNFARHLYDNLHHNLDWGIIATAVIWHDASRANYLGVLYLYNFKHLRKIPLLQDFNMSEVFFKDAFRSRLIMKKEFKKIGLDRKFIKTVGSAILGTDNNHLGRKKITVTKLYQKFTCDADVLDLFTIGRWECLNRNVVYKGIGDKNFLNRAAILNFIFNIPKIADKVSFNLTKKIAKLVAETSLAHSKEFYPTDYQFAADALSKFN
jgi:hypothetical protein